MENLEWRRIREEQDLAYEQMLEADRQRDMEISNEAKKKKVCNSWSKISLLFAQA